MIYLLKTGFRDPYENMAIDEALMEFVKKEGIPVLRFFNFSPPSTTIGFHQRIEEWLLELEKKGVPWVRRPTGGRAVFHDGDLTYSLTFPEDHEIFGGSVPVSFMKISQGFKRGFELAGIRVELESKKGIKGTGFCFSATSLYEFTINGKKIMGSAQVRRDGVVLQQGTVVIRYPSPPFPHVPGMGAIEDVKEISLEELQDKMVQGFQEVYGIEFKPLSLSSLPPVPVEKYRSREWNWKESRPRQ